MCHVSHPDAISRHAALRADGAPGATVAQNVVEIRHGQRRLSPGAHDARATGRRLCLVLPPPLLALLDLAPPARGSAGGAALPGDVVSLQALEPYMAFPDSPTPDGRRLAPARGVDAPPACAVSAAIG